MNDASQGKRSHAMGSAFLRLWTFETISLFGTQITAITIPLTAIITLRATPLELGILAGARTAPWLLATLPAGVWVDRRSRRQTIVLMNLVQATLLALIPALAAVHALTMAVLISIAFVTGCAALPLRQAMHAIIPTLVPLEALDRANGRLAASESLAEVAGPGIGGWLAAVLGPPTAILADVVSFVVAALGIRRLPRDDQRPAAEGTGIGEGIRFTLGNVWLRAFAIEAASMNLGWAVFDAVLAAFAVRILGLEPYVLGIVFGAASLGAVVGSAASPFLARVLGLGRTILWASAVGGIVLLLIPVFARVGHPTASAALLGICLFVHNFAGVVSGVEVAAIRQAVTPQRVFGRAYAAYLLIAMGIAPLGGLAAGVVAATATYRVALLVGATCAGLAWLWLFTSPIRVAVSLETLVGPRQG
ncbi:MAG TPA: MFS transporter [Actinomycetota bacterium]